MIEGIVHGLIEVDGVRDTRCGESAAGTRVWVGDINSPEITCVDCRSVIEYWEEVVEGMCAPCLEDRHDDCHNGDACTCSDEMLEPVALVEASAVVMRAWRDST